MYEARGMTEPLLDLTIIIANYNTRELLQSCIESVYEHTQGVTFEVICVDDNSPDASADMVAALFPQVILFRNNQRLLYARNHNIGMRASRARYACHLDSDTLLTGNAFAAMVQFMNEHPGVAACGPKLLNADGSVQHCIRGFTGAGTFVLQALNWHRLFPASRIMNRYYHTDFDYTRAQQVQSIGTSAYIVRRSTWEQVGMFDERFGQFMVDLAYNFTLNKRGYRVYYTPCAEVIHYGSQSIRQNPVGALRDETEAFVLFNESYSYFRQGWLFKHLVRTALRIRLYMRLLEYHARVEKTVVKGPAAAYGRRAAEPVAVQSSEEF
jgi:GT2 family glycosyltransferase